MRLAVISDIHSNLEALAKVLEVIREQRVDEIVCLGDIVGYGANPNECVDLVRRHCSIVLLGNHDLAAVDPAVAEYFTMNARVAAQWTNRNLSPPHKEFLQTLPYTSRKAGSLLVHSSPFEPEEWHYIISAEDTRGMFEYFSESLCFVGHSHMPGTYGETSRGRRIRREERFIINVGSVGQPRDGNPALSFGIFDSDLWDYQNIRVPYDVQAARAKIIKAGLPELLGERLLMGM